MNMPKSRDIQAKILLPQAIWNEFWLSSIPDKRSAVYLVK